MNLNKILITDRKGMYSPAKITKNKQNLKPSRYKINKVNPRNLKSVGYSVLLTAQNPPMGENYPPMGKDYTSNKRKFARKCLTNFLESSNTGMKAEKADYILLKNFESVNLGKRWQVSAEVYYFKKIN